MPWSIRPSWRREPQILAKPVSRVLLCATYPALAAFDAPASYQDKLVSRKTQIVPIPTSSNRSELGERTT